MTDNETEPSGNFIIQCINISIFDESCLLGSSVLIISIILLVLSIKAFIKMTKFYKKMNFENTIILLSILQTIILQSVLITSYDIFFESFFLLQIFIISLIIRKFNILAKDPKTFFDKNWIFIVLNVLNFLIFLIYPLYLNIFKGKHLYVKLFYRIFHASTTCILSYYCCFFVKLTAKYKENYLNSYYSFYEEKLINDDTYENNNNDNNNINKNDKDKDKDKDKEEDKDKDKEEDKEENKEENIDENKEEDKKEDKEEKKEEEKEDEKDKGEPKDKDINKEKNNENDINDISKSNTKSRINIKKGEEFYRKKKKQISYLYSVNLFCAFIEICFTITRNFIIHEQYLDDDYKTIPKTTGGDIIYYIYLIVCFCNVSVNYLCFYYYIRHQYSYSKIPKKFIRAPEKKILDNNFIEEVENTKKSNNPDVNKFLFSSAAQNKDEEPVAVEIKRDDRGSIDFPDFDIGNNNSGNSNKNNALLPDEFSSK